MPQVNINNPVASAGGFIPIMWALTALSVLKANLAITKRVRRDTDFDVPARRGNVLNIPYAGTFSAPLKSTQSASVRQVPQGGKSVQVSLTSHRTTDFAVEDITRAQANPGLIERYTTPAAIAISEAIERDAMATLMGLPNAVGTPGTNLNAATINAAMVSLTAQKIPMTERFLVPSPKDQGAMLLDPALTNFFAFGRQEGVEGGKQVRLYDFDITDPSQLCPAVAPQTITIGAAATGGSFVLNWNGFASASLAWNCQVSDVLAALQSFAPLLGFNAGDIAVTGSGTGNTNSPFTVTFAGTAARYSSALFVDNSGMAGDVVTAVNKSGTPVATTNFALHPEALIFVPRPFEDIPDGSGVQSAQVDDPDTGISLRVLYQYDMTYRQLVVGFDVLYGFALLRPSAGLRVVC